MDCNSAPVLGLIGVTTLRARLVVMPAIHQATDQSDGARFKLLHGLSVVGILVHFALMHIALAGVVISLFI